MPQHVPDPRWSRPLGLLTVLAVVAAQLGAPPATAAPGRGPPPPRRSRPAAPDHDDAGPRPPSGPVVPVPAADDGALPAVAAAAPDAAALPVGHSSREIAPKVSLSQDRSYDSLGFVDSFLLTADLDGPTRPKLLAGSVSGATRPTELADAAHAVAATNGDFFAINATNAPIGGEIQDGQLLKADKAGSPAVGLDADGVGRIADLFLEGTATVGGRTIDLGGLNSNNVPANSAVLYTPKWGPGDRGYVAAAGGVVELEVTHGQVSAVRTGRDRDAGTGRRVRHPRRRHPRHRARRHRRRHTGHRRLPRPVRRAQPVLAGARRAPGAGPRRRGCSRSTRPTRTTRALKPRTADRLDRGPQAAALRGGRQLQPVPRAHRRATWPTG